MKLVYSQKGIRQKFGSKFDVVVMCLTLLLLVSCQSKEAGNKPAPKFIEQNIVDGPISVPALDDAHYSFSIENNATLTGDFTASGGSGNDIQVLLMGKGDYINWKNGHEFRFYYDSGKITVGEINVHLNPGNYYLVFSNRFGLLFGKKVDAHIKLKIRVS